MDWRHKLENGWVMYRAIALPEKVVQHCEMQEWERADQQVEPDEEDTSKDEDADSEWQCPLAAFSGPKFRLLDAKQAEADFERVQESYADKEDQLRQQGLLKRLRKAGEYRRLATLPEQWEKWLLDELKSQFPNFGQVNEYLHGMFALAALGDGVLRFDPLLLSGPPGVGKTFFAESLSQSLGTGFVPLRMENAQDNSTLIGSSEFWSNSKEGHLFSWLIGEEVANPIFFLDELDKVGRDMRFDPLSSLYSLLEPKTAASFTDLSFPWLKLNATGVLWIATANDPYLLPPPILSRFRHFHISAPTAAQSRKLVAQIFQAVCSELPPAARTMRMTKGAVQVLSSQAPRLMKRLLREAIGRSIIAKRDRITRKDISVETPERKARIGFLDF